MKETTKFEQKILIHGINEPKEEFRQRVERILVPLTTVWSASPNKISYKIFISQDEINTAGATVETKDEDCIRALQRAMVDVYTKVSAQNTNIKDFEAKQVYNHRTFKK